MKKRRVVLTGLGIVFSLITVYPQNNEPVNFNVIPPSPNALSMLKFCEIPVSTYTGIPKIDIPIYEYKGKYIDLPISLKYHAGGVRVEEIASNVGLGWALSAGGSVSRIVRGLADDMATYGYLAAGNLENCTGIFTPVYSGSKCYNYFTGREDSEQDIFYVNANNLSFKFTLSKEGVAELDPQLKIKVEKRTGSLIYDSYGNITEWIITDESGVKYSFAKREFTKLTSSSDLYKPLPPKYVVTSWYLTEIKAPFDFEIISFEYEQFTYKYDLNMSESLVPEYVRTTSAINMIAQRITRINTPDSGFISFIYDNGGYRCDLKGDRVLTDITVNSSIKEIRHFNLTYNYMLADGFESYNSCGFDGDHQLGKRLVLAEVEQEGNKPYQFFYYNGLPARDSKSQDHWGFYNGESNTTLLPETYYYTKCFDIGYQKIGNANRRPDSLLVKSGSLNKIKYPTSGSTSFEYEINKASNSLLEYSLVNKNYSLDGISGTSKQITIHREQLPFTYLSFTLSIFPPGCIDSVCGVRALIKQNGTTVVSESFTKGEFNQSKIKKEIKTTLSNGNYEFTFEYIREDICPDMPDDPFMLELNYTNESTDNNKLAGGIRISRITENPDSVDNNNKMEKWYEYVNQDRSSSGYILHQPVYLTLYDFRTLPCYFGSLTSTSRAVLGNTQGSPVGYSRVIEHFGEENENGYTEYRYTSPNDYPDQYGFSNSSEFPFVPPSSFENWRGLLTRKQIWNSDNVLVEKLINTYDISSTFGDGMTNVKVGNDESWKGDGKILIGQNYTNYQIRANLASTRAVNYYETGDSVVVVTDFSYSTIYNKVSSKKVSYLTDGEILMEKYYYPQDFTRNINIALDTLFYGNNFNVRIINETWKGINENNLYMIGSSANVYKNSLDGKVFLDEIYSLKADKPLAVSEILEFDPNKILRKPEFYFREAKFKSYDDRNNILEYIKSDGVCSSFYWGYYNTYPVARFENMNYSVIENNINGLRSELDYLDNYTVLSDSTIRAQLKSHNDLIRTKAPANAIVTTFTYDPQVGMTSRTDPNGITIYYEYDSLQRLSFVRDKDWNIIKRYEYHYAD
jgi:YD repeat-containing protein